MSKTITRRAALTGTAAGAAAIVAGTGQALANEHPDAELLELERQMEALIEPLHGTYARMGEAGEALAKVRPQYPYDEMRYSPADRDAGLPPPETYGGGWCGWAIGEARKRSGLSPAALQRLDELEAIDARYNDEARRVGKACGHDQAVDAHDVLMDQVDAITERAGEIEPQTLDGVAVKARIVAFQVWDMLFKVPERDMDWNEQRVRQFLTDAMRLGGRAPLPMPWAIPS